MEGPVVLLGRDVLFKDTDPLKYPPNAYLFDVWECYGKFDSKLIGKSYLPLCVPTKDEFKVNFKIEDSYEQFLRKFKLKAPQSDKPNPLIPSMFIFPFSEEEFEMKNFSGDYRTIASMFNPGELVTHITKGPIFKPAKLFSLESDGRAKIEYSEFDGDKSTKIVSTTVGYNEYAPLQRAGPNFGIHEKVPIPQSMVDWQYDQEFNFYLNSNDLEPFLDLVEIMANRQYMK